jgi:hypothetical protein
MTHVSRCATGSAGISGATLVIIMLSVLLLRGRGEAR